MSMSACDQTSPFQGLRCLTESSRRVERLKGRQGVTVLIKQLLRLAFSVIAALSFALVSAAHVGTAHAKPIFFKVRQGYATTSGKGGIVRAHSQVDRNGPLGMARPLALYAIALAAKQKGLSRFAVVKSHCGTLIVSGIETSHMCDLKAQLLNQGEEAPPAKESEVLYFDVAAVVTKFEANSEFFRPY